MTGSPEPSEIAHFRPDRSLPPDEPAESQPQQTTRPRRRYQVVRSVFLRGMGIVYLIAFASFWGQAMGLIGSEGILPVAEFLDAAGQQLGVERYWRLPTVFWLSASDTAIHLVCGVGCAAAVALIVGVVPLPMSILLWAGYLSLVSAGRVFMGYQWDALLLEAGLLTIFTCPLNLWPRLVRAGEPARIVVWLHRWLVFRLLFMSGAVKLASGDETWANLTALTHHYETQPLPNVLGWWAHQLPDWFHIGSTAAVLFLELVVPFAALGPRIVRLIGFFGLVGLQVLILLTGSYCFFNLLTLLLCLWLLDDAHLLRWPPRRLAERLPAAPAVPVWRRSAARIMALLLGLFIATGSVYHLGNLIGRWAGESITWPRVVQQTMQTVSPFRAVNSYGLFANMTTRRPEIIVQGSNDGRHWKSYRFAYKPGELDRRPVQAAPHQPRLGWQMWFEALRAGRIQRSGRAGRPNIWFVRFLRQLLHGSKPVLALMEHNPFPDEPPKYIRAVLYEYQFTDPATLSDTGRWWKRDLQGMYVRPMRLRNR